MWGGAIKIKLRSSFLMILITRIRQPFLKLCIYQAHSMYVHISYYFRHGQIELHPWQKSLRCFGRRWYWSGRGRIFPNFAKQHIIDALICRRSMVTIWSSFYVSFFNNIFFSWNRSFIWHQINNHMKMFRAISQGFFKYLIDTTSW